MATDFFLKIDGIEGESADSKHRGEIQIEAFSLGVGNSVSGSAGGGAGGSSWQDFRISAKIDKSYPKLKQACSTGEHIKNAVLTARKAGKEQLDYLKITLTDIIVSEVELGGTPSSSAVPYMHISLNYASIDIEQAPQKQTGILGGKVKVRYDIPRAKKK